MKGGGGGGGGGGSPGLVLPFGYPNYLNLPPQETFDHPKDGYVCDSWGDTFSSCE